MLDLNENEKIGEILCEVLPPQELKQKLQITFPENGAGVEGVVENIAKLLKYRYVISKCNFS